MTTKLAERLLATVRSGDTAFGTALHLSDPDVLEIVAVAGYDWVSVISEHASLGLAEIGNLQRAADARGITTLIHVGSVDDDRILPLLNLGVGGIVAPQVESAADVERLVRACRFPPVGDRGAHGSVRSADYGAGDYEEYVATVDQKVVVGVVVETTEALESVDAVLAVDGLDVAFLGLTDLAQALGVPDQFKHPTVAAAVARVAAAAREAEVTLAVSEYGYTPAEIRDLGAGMILAPTSDLAFLTKAFREHLAGAKRSLAEG
jgi:2-keto-3-deoxy-L-rhamnonate aldolase RhmA